MSFISWSYALFLPLVFVLYWGLPVRFRIPLLLLASYVFYGAWDARFLALLATSTTTDYLCGLAIAGKRVSTGRVFGLGCLPVAWLAACAVTGLAGRVVDSQIILLAAFLPVVLIAGYPLLWRLSEAKRPRAFLWLSVGLNLGQLVFFKYSNFFADSFVHLAGLLGWHPGWTMLKVILPVGISFYTFQSISYSVDIYRKRIAPEERFLTFATFLSFFPQLVAGPIERSPDLLPQLQKPTVWSIDSFHRGGRLILIGLFKKVFVADNAALLANYAFDNPAHLNLQWALLGALSFAFQIYGDFSGYTDIARGSARMLGVQLRHNFHFPYFATGPSDFWQRWHITLSSWFRDYVYIPLGGNRGSSAATLRNLVLTMALAGLWHGAAWTFVVWGVYHGLLLVLYRMVPSLERLEMARPGSFRGALAMLLMGVFTLVGWVIFRSGSLAGVGSWFAGLTTLHAPELVDAGRPALWLLIHVGPLLLLQAATWRERDEVEVSHWPWVVRGIVYALLFLAVASSAVSEQEFIYFQF